MVDSEEVIHLEAFRVEDVHQVAIHHLEEDFGGPSRSSGYHHRRPYHSPHHHPDPFWGRPHYHWHRPGFVHPSTMIILFLIVLFILVNPLIKISPNSNKISKNTTERVALKGVVSKTNWYTDNIGWISSKSQLLTGLENFYNKTGIQPYILLIPYSTEFWNGNSINATKADAYLEQFYKTNFKDEGHFIFAYFQCLNDSKTEMDGEFRYLSGYSADTIMDNEAINILWGYFEKNYYNTSLNIEEMISNTFSETAKSIMSKPTNGWDFAKNLMIIVLVIVIIIILYKTIKNKYKREKEKEKFTEKILEKPLETFGTDTSELEKKYEDK